MSTPPGRVDFFFRWLSGRRAGLVYHCGSPRDALDCIRDHLMERGEWDSREVSCDLTNWVPWSLMDLPEEFQKFKGTYDECCPVWRHEKLIALILRIQR